MSALEGARAPDPFAPEPIGWVLIIRSQVHDFRDVDACAQALALCHSRGDTAVRPKARTSLTRYRDLTEAEQDRLTMAAAGFVFAGLR